MILVLTLRWSQLSDHAVCYVSQFWLLFHYMTHREKGLCRVPMMLDSCFYCSPQLGGFVILGHAGCFQFISYLVAKDPLTEELISEPKWSYSHPSQACKIQPKDIFRVCLLQSGT